MRVRMHGAGLAMLVGCACFGAADPPDPGPTTATWQEPSPLETSAITEVVDFDAMIAGGNGIVAWTSRCTDDTCLDQYALSAIILADGSFGPAEQITTDYESKDELEVAIDADGNATVAWRQVVGSYQSLTASRRPSGGTWGAPERLDVEQLGDVGRIDIAGNDAGAVAVIWEQNDSVTVNVWTSRFESGTWTGAEKLNGTEETSLAPAIAVAPDGTAIAAWCSGGGVRALYARLSEGSWSAEATLGESSCFHLKVRAASDGSIVVAWEDGPMTVARYTDAWSTPVVFAATPTIYLDHALATGPDDTALVLWSAGLLSTQRLYRASYQGSWQVPTAPIETTGDSATYPSVVFGDEGGAIATWTQVSGEVESVWAQQYDADEGWQGPAQVSGPGGAARSMVLFDAGSHLFVALWLHTTDSLPSLYWSRFE